MKKMEAEETLEELLEVDSLGIAGSMTDEQLEAVRMAYRALKRPESLTCGYCQRLTDDTADGGGKCEVNGRTVDGEDRACPYYE